MLLFTLLLLVFVGRDCIISTKTILTSLFLEWIRETGFSDQ
jgi:hypothetical protein